MCQKLFLSDVETKELEVTGGTVPDEDELPPDAIMRRETHQVHAKEKQQQVFRVKKTRGVPMGRPKLELLASNGILLESWQLHGKVH